MPDALSADDLALIAAAREIIGKRYRPGWHVIGAALRTHSGRIFTGVHLEAHVGRIAVCAEAIALGRAATEAGDTAIDTIVAVRYAPPGVASAEAVVVAPCGMCREMIADYSPEAFVIIPLAGGGLGRKSVRELLPDKYERPAHYA